MGAVLLVVLAPLLAVIAAAVRVRLGPPVLFRQARVGRHEAVFTMWKFRSMSDARDPGSGVLLPDADRLEGLGRFLRGTGLDELPGLWNVARGEMRLVGPRPLPPEYLGRLWPEERRRHEVHPGLTGWAAVNGRNALGWDERLALDVWYVDHRSLRLDLTVLLKTVATVLRRDGVAPAGHISPLELPVHRVR